ncbi:hypothetical protein [Yoonia sp.]|uniref:hypothetical protein n=1 Tax=Yoonia sp. TaxID=2212373 RepID=UPI003A4DE806
MTGLSGRVKRQHAVVLLPTLPEFPASNKAWIANVASLRLIRKGWLAFVATLFRNKLQLRFKKSKTIV